MAEGDLESRGTKTRANNYSHLYTEEEEEDDDDIQWRSWLIPCFAFANVAVFIAVMFVNDCPKHRRDFETGAGKCVARFIGRFSFQPLKENPLFGPSSLTLMKLGGIEWMKVVEEHEWWRLISSTWLHAGLIHLLVNMFTLLLIGIRLEQQFGFGKIGVIYVLSGFGGGVLCSFFVHKSVSVGASGAVFGLIGAMFSEIITNWTIYTNKRVALCTLLVIVIVDSAVGILPHVDNFAHAGGFLTGCLSGFILLTRPQFGWVKPTNLPAHVSVKPKYKAYQYALWFVSLFLLITGFTVGLVMLYWRVNGNHHCRWCHYLSCVPTSKWSCQGN